MSLCLPAAVAQEMVRQQPALSPKEVLSALATGRPGDARLVRSSDGRIRALVNLRTRSYQGTPLERANDFLLEYRETLGLKAVPQLRAAGEQTLEEREHLRFVPLVDGIEVRGSEIVLVSESGVVTAAHQSLPDLLPAAGRAWTLSADEARERARAAQPLAHRIGTAQQIWLPSGNALRPVWAVQAAGRFPHQRWEVQIAADNGDVLGQRSLVHGQRADVFPTNPIKSQLTRVPLPNLRTPGVLTGRFATIYSYYPSFSGLVAPFNVRQFAEPANGDFLFPLFDPRFSEPQLYYGIDRIAARFRELGVTALDRPLEAVAYYFDYDDGSGFTPANNAFFSSEEFNGRGGLFFYVSERGADTAYDNDIVFHEYTHAVVNSFVPGARQGNTYSAMNEAFADYFSASLSNDPDLAEWAAVIFPLRGDYLRTTDNQNLFPQNLIGQIHADGNIWSGALWDVRTALGRDVADRIAINTLARLTGAAEFYDGALTAVRVANELYGSATAQRVAAIMIDRGIGTDTAELAANAKYLLSGDVFDGTVPASSAAGSLLIPAQQLRIEVPHQATALRVEVEATGNVRPFLRFRAPVLVENGQVVADQRSPAVAASHNFSLTLQNRPELQRGTYYVVVANASTSPVSYRVRLTAVGGSPTATPAVTALTPGVASSGSVPSGPFLASRQFSINVPTNGQVTVNVRGNTDVDLYVNRRVPVDYNSQGLPEADVVSETALSTETIVLGPNTVPQATPGRHYLAVYNYDDTSAAEFSVTANVSPGTVYVPQLQALANGATGSFPLTIGQGAGVTSARQFRVSVPANARTLQITLPQAEGVQLLVRQGSAVAYRNGELASDYQLDSEGGRSVLRIDTASLPPLRPGTDYFLAMVNYGTLTTANVQVRVETSTATGAKPVISTGGVVNAAAAGQGLAEGAFFSIYGQNLNSGAPTEWGSFFQNGMAPTGINSTRVLVNGRPAFLSFVSAGQINAIFPAGTGTGNFTLEVERDGVLSDPLQLRTTPIAPALFSVTSEGGRVFAAATAGTGPAFTYIGPAAPGSRPARPGETIVLYGTGFGVTNPATVIGRLGEAKPLAEVPSFRLNTAPAQVVYAGGNGLVGIYQFNIVIPATLTNGDYEIRAQIGGVETQAGVFIRVAR